MLPHYPLPVLRLVRLAVDRSAQGHGVGKLLLRAVSQIVHEMAESVGCVGVGVDAKPDAIRFYERYGLQALGRVRGHIEPPTRTVADVFGNETASMKGRYSQEKEKPPVTSQIRTRSGSPSASVRLRLRPR